MGNKNDSLKIHNLTCTYLVYKQKESKANFLTSQWHNISSVFAIYISSSFFAYCIFRYYAIVRPLEYPLYMTNRTVFFMLANVWLLPALISFTPIFLGWYTTTESLRWQEEHTDSCIFVANKTYAIISSSVSFWIPGFVMITMYCRIYR